MSGTRLAWRVALACTTLALCQPPGAVAQQEAKAAPAPPAASPEKSRALPGWLELGVEFRGRADGGTAAGFVPGRDDFYYLHRIRLHAGFRAAGWLRGFVQAQNAEAPGHRPPAPNSVQDRADIHQAYLDIGQGPGKGWNLRAGRQEINFGEQRLVGSANWGNVGRSFDALRLSWERPGWRLDCFASTVVQTRGRSFNRFTGRRQLHGVHLAAKDRLTKGTVEAYTFYAVSPDSRSESGATGQSRLLTFGVRALGPLPRRFDYRSETAFQAGSRAGDPARAWAGTWTLGYLTAAARRAPRLLAGYSFASGDKDPRDNRAGTFDQLYPTNHFYYGIADRISWRNLHATNAGVEVPLAQGLNIAFEHHSFWLATRRDALYNFGGQPVARNPAAGSPHLGQELDLRAVWQASKQLQFVLGYARIFPGRFLRESTAGGSVTAPYAQWLYRF